MGPMGGGHGISRHELCPRGKENSLPCKTMSKKDFNMTQLLCGLAANKSKCDWGEILATSLCGSMLTEKLGHFKKIVGHNFAW